MPPKNNNNPVDNAAARQQAIERFLLDPDKAIFETLEQFAPAVSRLVEILSAVNLDEMEQLVGQDGKTPVRGVDYMTQADLEALEKFIISKIPKVGVELASRAQVEAFIRSEVAKIPRVKGDPGKDGSPGRPGKDGSPDTGADIVAKLRSLGKNQMLKISDIRGLENVLIHKVSDEQFAALEKRFDEFKIIIPANPGGGGEGNDATAIHSDGVDEFSTITEDATPAAGDYILAERASDGVKIKIPFSAIGDGADGRTVLNGSGAPDVGDGIDGDFYIDTDEWDIYGPKAGGAWGSATSLVGPQGPAGSGSGDMLAATYDPGNVNDDAFDMENMTEGATKKILTAAERTKLGHLTVTQAVDLDTMETQAAAGAAAKVKTDFLTVTQAVDLDTMETDVAASKAKTDHISVSQAVDLDAIETRVNALDAAVILKGSWDASAGTFPGGGSAQAGESWIVSVSGTVDGVAFTAGDRIIAILDNASTGTFAANWFKADYTDLFTTQTLGDLINGASAKTTPVDADMVALMDSAASNVAKKLSWANIKATIKTYLDSFYQPLDADLTTIAGLTATTNNFIVAVSSAWASRTPAQVKTTLALDNVDNTSDATKNAATATLTNKRINPRVRTTASSATPTPNADTDDMYTVTALAAGATFGAPSGTPVNGQSLVIRIKDNGTARTLAFNAIYRAVGITLPTTTVISKTIYLGMFYNSADTKWDVVAYALEA